MPKKYISHNTFYAVKGSNKFLSGAFIATFSTVIVKILGLFYKIPMLSLIGGEGMGYFNSSFEIYALLCGIFISGMPVAISIIVSSKKDDGYKIFLVLLKLIGIIGMIFSVILAMSAHKISLLIKSENAYMCILFISPAVFFSCLSGVYRGYFQGVRRMIPTCISEILEAFFKLTFGFLLSYIAKRKGVLNIAPFASLGVSISSMIGFLSLFIFGLKDKNKAVLCVDINKSRVIKKTFKLALPVTLSSFIISLAKSADMAIILRRLQNIGYESEGANYIYGCYATLCLPMFSLAPSLVTAITLPLIPELSISIADNMKNEQRSHINNAMKLMSYISIPAFMGIFLFSHEILSIVFMGRYEEINISYIPLSILSCSIFLSALISVSSAILQSYKHTYMPLITLSIGTLIKIMLSYILVGNTAIGISGSPISTFVCDLVICVLNIILLLRVTGIKLYIKKIFLKPLAISFVSVFSQFLLMRYLEGKVNIPNICFIFSAMIIYLILSYKEIVKEI